ncbi:MAG: CPBP family glutamic-type intramembrane protease [Phycisphaerales bacterium]|nr:CPBP family glutamic-type intramembrane protease [Phycisphaerales bacterium]
MKQRQTASEVHEPSVARRLSYWAISRQPLQILAFLLPLIIAYEIALVTVLNRNGVPITNIAHQQLIEMLEGFAVPARDALFFGGLIIVVVLLFWHLFTRAPWRISGSSLLGMVLESILLTAPLIILWQLISQFGLSGPLNTPSDSELLATVIQNADQLPTQAFSQLTRLQQLTIAIGAGLYEELLFRMVLIALAHYILVDLLKTPQSLAIIIAIALSAIAFAWYHPTLGMSTDTESLVITFYFLAGVYFAGIYVIRGFGIVVGVHAAYDCFVALTGG